ncbi:hypothetical protein TNCT_187051 [Trichonephila clavata]|uniref:Uncharacterized protein n=1 Tax=Trichonephila clavata TaxID=2740835 RepID=A0A8X6KWN8_TRICU|nr:hypothetical protein TNCT_187051 [Trichonephila clavata]
MTFSFFENSTIITLEGSLFVHEVHLTQSSRDDSQASEIGKRPGCFFFQAAWLSTTKTFGQGPCLTKQDTTYLSDGTFQKEVPSCPGGYTLVTNWLARQTRLRTIPLPANDGLEGGRAVITVRLGV